MRVFRFVAFACFFIGILVACSGAGSRGELKPINYIGSYNRDFNDLNALHLEAAKKLGVEPVASREEAEHMKRKLKEIKSNDFYEIEDLTHSIPYLVPEAKKLLETIGENFRDSLDSHNAPLYKLRVTSVTRTKEDITKLRKRNYNSSENSAHMYATTFDISWSKYIKAEKKDTLTLSNEQLKMLLAGVLRDLQKADKCYVKHERKQGCFHITAR
ncbi:MAG: DUF5715 family protein [Bacteroidales bacterium]|nr:DUF5715 family protein [Bacteroidales bacterium]